MTSKTLYNTYDKNKKNPKAPQYGFCSPHNKLPLLGALLHGPEQTPQSIHTRFCSSGYTSSGFWSYLAKIKRQEVLPSTLPAGYSLLMAKLKKINGCCLVLSCFGLLVRPPSEILAQFKTEGGWQST